MSVNKDIHRLIRTVGKLTDGQARVCELIWDDGKILGFRVQISPNSGLYKGGRFKLKITLPDDYSSDTPPTVRCETDIFHPNIDTKNTEVRDTESNVCLDLFYSDQWKKMYGLENIVAGLVYLLYNPNLDSPLCSYLDFDLLDCQGGGNDGFEDKVRMYMRGENIDGIKFSPDFLKQDQQQDETGIEDNLVKLGIDEESFDTADEYEGCTMMTVESISWGDDIDMDETILVPCEATQCCIEINNQATDTGSKNKDKVKEAKHVDDICRIANDMEKLTKDIDKDHGTRNSIGRNASQRRNNSAISGLFYFHTIYDRIWQVLPSLRRFSLTDTLHRLKQSFIRNH